jgi:hypothetical protein
MDVVGGIIALLLSAVSAVWNWCGSHETFLAIAFALWLIGKAESDIRDLKRRLKLAEIELEQLRQFRQ